MADLVRGLQERAGRALPAERVEELDGWVLRYAPDCSWWVGTVLPHGAADRDEVLRKLEATERFYAGLGTTPRIQVCPPVCPDGLDEVLAERSYQRGGSISLQVASTADVLERVPSTSLSIQLEDRPTRSWFDVWLTAQEHDVDARGEWELLGRVNGPSTYASAYVGDGIVAVGRAVVDTGWVGVFGMATLPEARGKGAAREVLSGLAGWARGHAVEGLYLQVEQENRPATRLYEQMGFTELSGYHYRSIES